MALTPYLISFLLLVCVLFACVSANSSDCNVDAKFNIDKSILHHGSVHYMDGSSPHVVGSTYLYCQNTTLSCYKETTEDESTKMPDVNDCIQNQNLRKLGVSVASSSSWPLNTVCYEIQSNEYSETQYDLINAAIAHVEDKTNVKFISLDQCKQIEEGQPRPCGNCNHQVYISKGPKSQGGCSSHIGYIQNENQQIFLSDKCFKDGTERIAIHEVGHTLGLHHEHIHPDRRVLVLVDEVAKGRTSPSNYIMESRENSNVQLFDYDIDSIMHYPLTTKLCVRLEEFENTKFCDLEEDPEIDQCVKPVLSEHCDLDTDYSLIGNRQDLSVGDIATLNALYPEI